MKIELAEVFLLSLPLSQPLNHHIISRTYTDNIVVRLRSNGLDGYGEGVPRSYVTGETARSAIDFIKGTLIPPLAGRDFASIEEVRVHLFDSNKSLRCQNNLSAFCAVELALLDLACKWWDCSLESVYRARWRQPPPYSAVVPLLPPSRLEHFLSRLKQNDMRNIKLKVGARIDPTVFEKTLSILGPDVDLRVDVNGAWTEQNALKNIERLGTYGVRAVEQPVAKRNLQGLKKVASQSVIPIIADESVCSFDDARRLLDMKACHAFNVRLSKCGGFSGSLAILDMAKTQGLRCQIGCQVGETGILSAAGRHVAGWSDGLLYLEGSFGTWVLQEDIVEEDIRFGQAGHAPPLAGKGLGVNVREESLEKYSKRSETVRL
ncbi:MAG: hypothetical protein GTN81_10560 [Proteobacteria bacterium]|nr:hypothetical protein [Pseudomonadota bacterium]